MIDRNRDTRSTNLEPLQPDATTMEIGIAAVMARVRHERQRDRHEVFDFTRRSLRLALLTTVAAAAVALITVALTNRRIAEDEPVNALAAWVRTSHVPSNAELLATFQGYRR